MRIIRFRKGEWTGYNGKKIIEFNSKEEAAEWKETGKLPEPEVADEPEDYGY